MYGGTSVGDIIISMNKVENYKPDQVQELQQNLTNLLHARKNCKTPDCVQLRRFIGDFIQHKMTRKKGPVRHALPPSGPRPNTTAKAPVKRTTSNVPRNPNGSKQKPAGNRPVGKPTGPKPKPRNAPPPMGPAPRSATPAGRAEAAAKEKKEANNWNAARNLAGQSAANENAANKEANNWNAARNLAGKAASKENAENPPFTAANKNKLEEFLSSNENAAAPPPPNMGKNTRKEVRNVSRKRANENVPKPVGVRKTKKALAPMIFNPQPSPSTPAPEPNRNSNANSKNNKKLANASATRRKATLDRFSLNENEPKLIPRKKRKTRRNRR